jgi:flagellar biosynthesis protein FliR
MFAYGDAGLLVFARCAGFVFRAPGFSHPDVPSPVRAGFAFMVSLAFAHAYAASAHFPRAGFVFALAIETLIGAAIGTAASMLYDGAYAGGRALDDYVGIRASVPTANVAAGAGFGRLWSLAFTTGFFVLGGYRIALDAFGHAFVTLPPGALSSARDLQTFAVALPVTLVRAAFFVAGPAIAVAFVLQFSLAIVARLVPRLSTFTLAFPIVFAAVLLATIAALPWVLGASAQPWLDLTALRAR